MPRPLPPYAPELNRLENVWQYLRANKLSGRVWDDYDEILSDCADAWNWLLTGLSNRYHYGMTAWYIDWHANRS